MLKGFSCDGALKLKFQKSDRHILRTRLMAGIIGIVALLTVLFLSLIIIRVATVALTMTGLSQETAHFQAMSAFTGTGFTTSEAETVVNHPVRKRIIMILMILRSAGLVTIIISLILSFLGPGNETAKLTRLLWILIGVIVLWIAASSRTINKYMARAIEKFLKRWTNLELRDYASLLRLAGGYNVKQIQVRDGDWVAGKNLRACYLPEEGITVLGINRSDGSYVGGPKGDTEVFPGDTLILYGKAEKLQQLDKRRADRAGDQAHYQAVDDEKRQKQQQDMQEQSFKRKRQANLRGEM